MLSSYHRRQMLIYLVVFAVLLVVVGGLLIFAPPKNADDWASVFGIALLALLFFALAMREYRRARHTAAIAAGEGTVDLLKADQLIVKRAAGFFPQFWFFYTDGTYLGQIAVERLPWYAHVLKWLPESSLHFWVPLTYAIRDGQGQRIGRFHVNGKMKLAVTIMDGSGKQIGTYRQNDWKTVLTIRGVLEDAAGRVLMYTKVNGSRGDFSLTDEAGKHWAAHRSGWVPVEQQQLFQDYHNPYVQLNNLLSSEERIMLLAMITTWFARTAKA